MAKKKKEIKFPNGANRVREKNTKLTKGVRWPLLRNDQTHYLMIDYGVVPPTFFSLFQIPFVRLVFWRGVCALFLFLDASTITRVTKRLGRTDVPLSRRPVGVCAGLDWKEEKKEHAPESCVLPEAEHYTKIETVACL